VDGWFYDVVSFKAGITTESSLLYAWKYIDVVDLALFSKNDPDNPIAIFNARKPPDFSSSTLIIKPVARHMEVAIIFSLMIVEQALRVHRDKMSALRSQGMPMIG